MDPNLLVAVIGGISTIIAAVVGAMLAQTGVWDRLFFKSRFPNLAGTRWVSSWTEVVDGGVRIDMETFEFTKQRRSRVYGQITMDNFPDLKWDLEGDYNDRFLRLFWTPSRSARNGFFLDYGCYFFERKGTGEFVGYAVGFDSESDSVEVYQHQLRRVAN